MHPIDFAQQVLCIIGMTLGLVYFAKFLASAVLAYEYISRFGIG